MKIDIEQIERVLARVIHPENGKSIAELSLVKNIQYDEEENLIEFRLVFPRQDPLASSIKESCQEALTEEFGEVKIRISELVDTSGATARKRGSLGKEKPDVAELSDVENVIAIASGKGGVGKSSVTVNLAVTLARKGFKVGVIDADIYGPSIPKMIGCEDSVPQMVEVENYNNTQTTKQLIVPIEKYGVKWISIGFFVSADQALIWRGPMATRALNQLTYETRWGELDYLLIDLPPGTSDIHISMIQEIALTGAIIVTTPQSVATIDVEKGINMFHNDKISVPILGVVENMSWFTPAELPNNRYYIFGKDGGAEIARKHGLKLLAQIPIIQSVMNGGEAGEPATLEDGPIYSIFSDIAVLL